MSRYTLSIPPLAKEAKRSSHVLPHPLPLSHRDRKRRDAAQLQHAVAVAAREGLKGLVLLGGRVRGRVCLGVCIVGERNALLLSGGGGCGCGCS